MFTLGERSLKELEGVHPDLVAVVKGAIKISMQDFSVHDGLRTELEQAKLVQAGASQTMNSKHRPQPDGFGHAVDLVPFINGKLRWEWPPIYLIAEAVRTSAKELGVRVRWGGCWSELTATMKKPELLVAEYVRQRKAVGKNAFIDGPHYELML